MRMESPLAFGLFGKKKKGEPEAPAATGDPSATPAGDLTDSGSATTPSQPDPVKAKRFFDRAHAVHDSTNYEYAMTLWLQGLRMDPTSVEGLENFAKSASEFLNSPGRPKGPTKDQLQAVAVKGPYEKYLSALLYWSAKPLDWSLGLKAFDQAVKLGLTDPAYWLGKRVLGIAGEDKKARKDAFVQIMELFKQINAFDQAVVAGDIACRLDPTDPRLASEVKNMSAQATMKRSGFEEGGKVEAGAFRRNVKDMGGQRHQEEEERIVKTEEVQERAIDKARTDYDLRPADMGAIQKIARLLLERGTPQDEKTAYEILMRGYKDTQNYRFKTQAGDINLRVARRQVREIRVDAAANESSAEKQQRLRTVERQLAEMEMKEFEERVENTPTDLNLRYDLGEKCLMLGLDEKAIEHFQMARGSPGIAVPVLRGLGVAFGRLGWLDEAEASYREAISVHPVPTDELASELRYGLMDVLQRRAEEAKSLPVAEEAFKLASSIAVQRIGFRDIRARRTRLQEMVKALRDGKTV